MSEKGYSAFGLDPTRLRDILRPLVEQMGQVGGTTLPDRRERFIYFQLVDAYLSAECLLLIADAGLEGRPVGMGAIEGITRRLVEQAIVVRYVHAASAESVVESFLKTSAHEWERSWGHAQDPGVAQLPAKHLPKYRQMAETVDPELATVYAKLSYLSHPRGAFPYTMRLADAPIEPVDYFKLNLAGTCVWIDIAVRNILYPYRGDPGASRY